MTLAHFAGKIARSLGLKYRDRYRAPKAPQTVLPGRYFELVERVAGSNLETPSGIGVYQQWAGLPGGHKFLHYFEVYDELFSGLRTRPIRMLEIGVYQGGSLRMWRKLLHADSLIVGIDIDPSCARFDSPDEHVRVRIGSQDDPAFLAAVAAEFGPFDVILDDGSHMCSHMIASFGQLFLPALGAHGLYIVEDTCTNFWRQYRDRGYSFIDLCKDLVDVMHSHYPLRAGESAYRIGRPEQQASLSVPRISAQIQEITFRDSIIAIRKKPVGPLPATQHN